MLCRFRLRNSNSGGSSAREICRHAAPKRPDFHKARNVRIGCPVPFSDQRIPAPFILLFIKTLLEDSTAPLPIGVRFCHGGSAFSNDNELRSEVRAGWGSL